MTQHRLTKADNPPSLHACQTYMPMTKNEQNISKQRFANNIVILATRKIN